MCLASSYNFGFHQQSGCHEDAEGCSHRSDQSCLQNVMNFKEIGVIKDHFSLKSTAGMKVKLITCHWNRHLQRSVTSTEASRLIYLFSFSRVCVNNLRCCFQRRRRREEGKQNEDAKSCVTRAAIHQRHSHSRLLRFRGVGHEMKTYGKSHLCCGDRTQEMWDCCRDSAAGTKPWKKSFCCSHQVTFHSSREAESTELS